MKEIIKDVGIFNKDNLSYDTLNKILCCKVSSLSVNHMFEGYYVQTNKHTYYLLIDNIYDNESENPGYLSSPDDFSEFKGAELYSFNTVGSDAFEKRAYNTGSAVMGTDCCFLQFETSEGTLEFAVYNSHNGYYGHSVLIVANDVTEEFI